MHDCLRVPEILDQILAIVLQDQPGVKGRNNVISVALSCREFHEIALDVAWKTQSSMVPVIKTLPQRCWKDSTPFTRFNDTPKTFDRYFGLLVNKLTAEEEERFAFYAKRIRRLEYLPFAYHAVPKDGCPYDLQIIRTIWATRTDKTQPLFPNLQHLIFAVIDHAEASLDIFLETKQVSLALYWNSPTNKTSSLFPIIEKHALNMQELDLGDFQDRQDVGRLNTNNDTADPLSGLVCKMTDLRALSCGSRSLNAKAIQHLSSLPHLRKLRVPNNSQEISRGLVHKQAQAYSQPFPELQELVIREVELPSFVGLMKELRPVRIQTLLLQLGHVPRTKEIRDVFVALVDQSSSQSDVWSIEFKFILAPDTRQRWQRPDPFALDKCTTLVDGSTLEPLLSFVNITVLDLDVPCKFDLGDTEIKAMADAWLRLRKLKLGSYLGWHHPSTITYDGLLYLLLKCPLLSDLAFAFDAASNVPPPSAISHAHVNKNITYLYIGDSRIGNNSPDSVGRFLARVMPRCQGISGQWIMQSISSNLSSKSCNEWDRVLEALKRCCQEEVKVQVQEPKEVVRVPRKEQNNNAKVASPPLKTKSFKLFG